MGTTTIRLDDELKERIAKAAAAAGKTPHAFMLDAIAATVTEAEEDEAFHRIADERWEEVQRTGMVVTWEDFKPWLEARARGENPPRPKPRMRAP